VSELEANEQPTYMSEQYIGYINRLCCAADIKNCADSNHFYDIIYDTMRCYRILGENYWA